MPHDGGGGEFSRPLKGGTLFSGIGAPECSASFIDWRWAAEIDPFASAVHAARFPDIPNLGDVTRIDPDAIEPVDVVVFGSPCQSFSVAGRRLGMDDARGNLALVALRLIGRIRPRWLVFENVPGLFSSFSGSEQEERAVREGAVGESSDSQEDRDFAAFLSRVRECGYLGCWRVYDAQHFGVPQRRRRIFFVGYLGDWRPPAAVLFEPESLRGDSPPRRETRERIARPVASCIEGGSGYRNDPDTADNLIAFSPTGSTADAGEVLRKRDGGSSAHQAGIAFGGNNTRGPVDIATACNAHGGPHGRQDFESETFVCGTLNANGKAAGSATQQDAETNMLIAFSAKDHGADHGDIAPTLRAGTHDRSHANAGVMPAIAFAQNSRSEVREMPYAGAVSAEPGAQQQTYIAHSLRADGFDASEDGTGRGTPPVPIQNATRGQDQNGLGVGGESMFTLDGASQHAVFESRFARNGRGAPDEIVPPLKAQSGQSGKGDAAPLLQSAMSVRRLTPRECERLQGFPDNWTAIPYRGKHAADGPRYRAIGNSMAVPVLKWILERLAAVHSIMGELTDR